MILSISYYQTGQYEKTVASCEKILRAPTEGKEDKHYKALVTGLEGTAYYKLNDLKQADTLLSTSLAFKPNIAILLERSNVRLDMGNQTEAKIDYKSAIDAVGGRVKLPPPFDSSMEMRQLQIGSAPLVEAVRTRFSGKGQERDWQNAWALAEQAAKLEASGEIENAIKKYTEATNLYAEDANLWLAYSLTKMTSMIDRDGKTIYNINSILEVNKALNKAVSLDDSNWRLWNDYGVFEYNWHNKPELARQKFNMALECKDLPDFQQNRIQSALKLCDGMRALKRMIQE